MSAGAEPLVPPFWRRPLVKDIAWQVMVLLLFVAAIWFFALNARDNLANSSLVFGWDFLGSIASFELGSNWIGFSAGDPVYKALLVGVINTLQVSIVAIILATILGIFIGIARLSSNPLAASLSRFYIEIARNIPLLLQLLFWYAVITRSLPSPRGAWEPITGIFLTNRGISVPLPEFEAAHLWVLIGFLAACIAVVAIDWCPRPNRKTTIRSRGTGILYLALLLGLPALIIVAGGIPLSLDTPVLSGFEFKGGVRLSPEYAALLLGLTLYTGAFIGEVVRGGILGVGRGQTEAAESLGLPPGLGFRKIILPQAMRIIIPPLGSQYLNIIKNSSLAVAIGYADIVRIATVIISETGHAIEMIATIMVIYLLLSLVTSGLVNLYNCSVMWEAR